MTTTTAPDLDAELRAAKAAAEKLREQRDEALATNMPVVDWYMAASAAIDLVVDTAIRAAQRTRAMSVPGAERVERDEGRAEGAEEVRDALRALPGWTGVERLAASPVDALLTLLHRYGEAADEARKGEIAALTEMFTTRAAAQEVAAIAGRAIDMLDGVRSAVPAHNRPAVDRIRAEMREALGKIARPSKRDPRPTTEGAPPRVASLSGRAPSSSGEHGGGAS
jgi:hypothetical protein